MARVLIRITSALPKRRSPLRTVTGYVLIYLLGVWTPIAILTIARIVLDNQ